MVKSTALAGKNFSTFGDHRRQNAPFGRKLCLKTVILAKIECFNPQSRPRDSEKTKLGFCNRLFGVKTTAMAFNVAQLWVITVAELQFLEVNGTQKSYFGTKSKARTRKAGPEIRRGATQTLQQAF